MNAPSPAIPIDADLAYATPASHAPRHGVRVWAAAAILFGGLGLIVLGGCFLMGVMVQLNPSLVGAPAVVTSAPPTPAARAFTVVLYTLAAGCFLGAAVVIATGLRGLAAIGHDANP